MKLFKVALVVSGMLLSLQSFAKQVVSIYVSNHAIYLTYGDASAEKPMAALQGSTSNPMLVKDVASWGTNDSPIKTFQVMLTTLKNTKHFTAIKEDLKSREPGDVSIRVFAAGTDSPLKIQSVKSTLEQDNIFGKEFRNEKEIEELLSRQYLKKWEAHSVLFKVAMHRAFDFDFPLPVAKHDSDFVKEVTRMKSCNSVLWATTYSVVHILDPDAADTEISSDLPKSLQAREVGGTYGFGRKTIDNMTKVENYKETSSCALLYKIVFDIYKRLSTMEGFPLGPNELIDRITHPETPLGFVNAGETVLEFLSKTALDTGATRDPVYVQALTEAKAALDDDQKQSFSSELENTKRIVQEDAVKKYLAAMWIKARESKTKGQGILLGEYSKGLFDDKISLQSYLDNDDFMMQLAQSLEFIDENQEKSRSELIEAIRSRFNDNSHSLIVIPQIELLSYLHRVGSHDAQQ